MDISSQLRTNAQTAIENLMAEVRGIKGVVISTEDGFELASYVENTAQVSRLAAMASSLAALSALAGEESQLGACDNMVMQAAEGFLVIVQVHRPDLTLILSVVAGRETVMGQVLYFGKQAAKLLKDA